MDILSIDLKNADFCESNSFWDNNVGSTQWGCQYERIYLIKSGEAELFLHGKILKLKQGFLYYIPSFSAIKGSHKGVLDHYYLHFNFNSNYNAYYQDFNFINEVRATPLDEELFIEISRLSNSDGKSYKNLFEANSIVQFLLSRFIANNVSDNNTCKYIKDAINYINKNIDKELKINDIANNFGLTPVYFITLFKKYMGISPLQYIKNKKLTEAMSLLTRGDLSIKEVAYKVGYNDPLYFSKLFKDRMGISPTEFKRDLK